METIKVKKECITLLYSNGWYIFDGADLSGDVLRHIPFVPTDYKRVFLLKNIWRYYIWTLTQKLFWKAPHSKMGAFLRKTKALHNAPYPIKR